MSLRILSLITVLLAGVSQGLAATKGLITKQGDRYAMVELERPNKRPLYELKRTSAQGETIVLWSSTSLERVPQASPSLSDVIALCDDGNEISLLVAEGESGGWVFRFPANATQADFVRVAGARATEHYGGLRFQTHGELIFDLPKDSIVKVVRFNRNGEITSDFRPHWRQKPIVDPRVTVKPEETDQSASLDDGSRSSGNSGSTAPQPGRDSKPTIAPVVETPLGSTTWPLWGGVMMGTVVLAYLFYKKREPQK